MTIFSVIFFLIICIAIAKRSTKLGFQQYVIIVIITLIQVGIIVLTLYTTDRPKLY